MKLYTEDQLLNTVKAVLEYDNEVRIENHLKSLQPIELPSDEEIITASLPTKVGSSYSSEYIKGFNDGAKWVLEQIKQ